MTAPTTLELLPPREEVPTQAAAGAADNQGMTAPTNTRAAAVDVKAAATRLAGVVVLDVADLTIRPALYDAKAGTFADLDGEHLGDDDGTLIVLGGRPAMDLVDEYGTPGRAAEALTREARKVLR